MNSLVFYMLAGMGIAVLIVAADYLSFIAKRYSQKIPALTRTLSTVSLVIVAVTTMLLILLILSCI